MQKNTRRITIEIPEELLRSAQAMTGQNVTNTICTCMKKQTEEDAYKKLLAMKGKYKFPYSIAKLRDDE